ncbi:hypothetical protein G9A89_002658 [Geosiphon pyriformis]|nr:hypothetical protein G9A89_002658 [Geosiphon pyriformis]
MTSTRFHKNTSTQSSSNNDAFPFYLGLIAPNKRTSPILNFLQRKVVLEKNAVTQKGSLEKWFPPRIVEPTDQASTMLTSKKKSSVPILQNKNQIEISSIPPIKFDGYLGLEKPKPIRYLSSKAEIIKEPLPYGFQLGLEYYLPPVKANLTLPQPPKTLKPKQNPTIHKNLKKEFKTQIAFKLVEHCSAGLKPTSSDKSRPIITKNTCKSNRISHVLVTKIGVNKACDQSKLSPLNKVSIPVKIKKSLTPALKPFSSGFKKRTRSPGPCVGKSNIKNKQCNLK